MIAICCDKDEKMIRGSFSDKGSVEEYKLTGMLNEMAADFNHGQPIIDRGTFTEKSLNKCKQTKPLAEWQTEIIPEISTSSLVKTENTMMLVFDRHKAAER